MVIIRVIAGLAKGHKLKTIPGMTTRPTLDRVKESLFSIILNYLPDSEVLDIFSGTGSLGIEALSRGAKHAYFVDKSKDCCDIIKENLIHTKLQDKSTIYNMNFDDAIVKLAAQNKKFDLIFLDPPYNKNFVQEMLKILMNSDIINDDGILIAEHHINDILPEHEGKLTLADKRKYGDTALSLYRVGGYQKC